VATEKLKNQMDSFLIPSSEMNPTMGLYDVATPQSAREGTPKRLFDPMRARYKDGDVVTEDTKEYNKALSVYRKMKQNNADDETIATYIGMPMLNRIKMNTENVTQAATGGLMGGDPRLGRVQEDIGYRAYQEGGEVTDEPMQVEELKPDVSMQMESAMTPGNDVETDATIDTSVLTSDEEQVLEQALEEYPMLMDIISKMTMKEFTGSGEVDGPGTGTSDSIPAMLSDGEFVFTAKSVKQIGVDKLRNQMKKAEEEYDRAMNVQEANQSKASDEPMMAKGGLLSTSI
tara:strand:+ start:969 stop:1832 length:864 start_codon:yes stop_codon:yes gene_type:complete